MLTSINSQGLLRRALFVVVGVTSLAAGTVGPGGSPAEREQALCYLTATGKGVLEFVKELSCLEGSFHKYTRIAEAGRVADTLRVHAADLAHSGR